MSATLHDAFALRRRLLLPGTAGARSRREVLICWAQPGSHIVSHADPRTTMRYDRARGSLDRHATYIVAAYVAGAAR